MKQIKWFDRKFTFEGNQNIFPALLERLSGTAIRLEEKLKEVPKEALTISIDNSWSIKKNIGHLIDLEPLWQGRLKDIRNGETELRPADLLNEKTNLADHNKTPLEHLLAEFINIRQETIAMLEDSTEETVFKSALHPRLKIPMRTMDVVLFIAEHDDHHLARITELINLTYKEETIQSVPLVVAREQYRVKFDFDISFTNGGSLQGKEFKLDLSTNTITNEELADYIVKDLRLLMVGETKIYNKEIINETHKRI